MAGLLDRILRMGEGRIIKQLNGLTVQVNSLEEEMKALSDTELRAETDKFKARVNDGESLEAILPEAFAAVREAAIRTLGQRHFDVQIMGGAALHLGNIAEMKTGEGKTLVATLPAYLNALSGKGVHVITVNDYLASYQSELMGRVFRFLGLTTGTITSGLTPEQRREQYNADITYGTNNEFGFDYLRDNMAWKRDDLVQRGHNMAIVDEVDSILIDEARTPLIISGPASGDINKWYAEFARVARRLVREQDYEVDEKKRTIGVLEPGIAKVEDYLGIENLYETLNTPLIGFLNNSIKAKELFDRDKDYVVMKGEVMIVDQHTGRMLAGRRYNDGMHQAIEAKEGVQIKAENQTFATVTLQNYFRMYDKLAGMTGTAETEAAEFQSTYEMGVVPIPSNRPLARVDQPDLIYKTKDAKFDAVVQDIVESHAKGQPVLVGTTNVETSELISGLLKKSGIPHDVLNAKQHAREASIVAMAGRKGAVTVATNMAGRGTDIMLGGNAEFIATQELEKRGLTPSETPEEYEEAWPAALEKAEAEVAEEHDEVASLGGLYVLGTERHESRRIDNQLRGRSGRQGDPGESRFYLSIEDDLMRLFNQALVARVMNSSGFPDDMPLESKMVTKGIASAQSQVEARNFEIRKNVLKYDDVLSRQRETVYSVRKEILDGEDLATRIQGYLEHVVRSVVIAATPGGAAENWDLQQLWTDLKVIYPVSLEVEEVIEEFGGLQKLSQEGLVKELLSDAKLAYAQREEELTSGVMREVERRVLLSVLDRKWREHLYEMDYLKEGIGLRAMAQRDPVVEYQIEGHRLFQAMDEAIKEETVGYIFNVKLPQAEGESEAAGEVAGNKPIGPTVDEQLGLKSPDQPAKLTYSAPSEDGSVVQSQGGRPRAQAVARPRAGGQGQQAASAGNREDRRRAARAGKKSS